ncbi:MAG: phosphotransferase [Acidobacteria bacterium]|nr:phosphotransferase [Acidobacteriota bacterium]
MQPRPSRFPDLQTLTRALEAVLGGNGRLAGRIDIVDRNPNAYQCYYASEAVTCRLGDGRKLSLFIKYGRGANRRDHGQPIGPDYEAKVYQRVLQQLQFSVPKFYGSYVDAATGAPWLIIEYLKNGIQAHKAPSQLDSLGLAARWLGCFHACYETRLSDPSLSFLHRYNARYYLQWARRTVSFEPAGNVRYPWLPALVASYRQQVKFLLSRPATVIHGDCYADNTLFRRGKIYPIDWEGAAVAAGEIDLASLTNGWHPEAVRRCVSEYKRARWPDKPPREFSRTLDAARLFVLFRLLGEARDWPDAGTRAWRFRQLRSVARRLGLHGC